MGLFNCFSDDDEDYDDDYDDEVEDEKEESSSCIATLGCTGITFLTGIISLIIGILFHNGWIIAISIIVLLAIFYFKFGRFCSCDSNSTRDVDDESKTYIDGRGYLRFNDSKKHVHRWVAEKYVVGRKLRSGEVVHHIDGDKLNNDPDNLEVMSKSEHDNLHGFRW